MCRTLSSFSEMQVCEQDDGHVDLVDVSFEFPATIVYPRVGGKPKSPFTWQVYRFIGEGMDSPEKVKWRYFRACLVHVIFQNKGIEKM
jgi:hypothetical protein